MVNYDVIMGKTKTPPKIILDREKVYNKAFVDAFASKKKFVVLKGGAGSGKSYSSAKYFIFEKAMKFPNRQITIFRKELTVAKDTILNDFKEIIRDNGIERYCRVYEAQNPRIVFNNGSVINFKDLDSEDKIKGLTAHDVMIDEADQISYDIFTQLTIRLRKTVEESQILVAFNPVSKSHWLYDEFFNKNTCKYGEDVLHVCETTYLDNIDNLPPDYVEQLQRLKYTNPLRYRIYTLGEWGTDGDLVYKDAFKITELDKEELVKKYRGKIKEFIGLDFGYVNDITAIIHLLLLDTPEEKALFILDEVTATGIGNDEIYDIIESKGWHYLPIVADSAEQKSIDEIKKYGARNITPSIKGKGSIISGIQKVKQYMIYVDSSCEVVIDELENYTFSIDKMSGKPTNKPVDKHNHTLDAIRYVVNNDNIKKRTNMVTVNHRRIF